MGVDSGIAWTHHTFNPWWGCEKVSPGCAHCYAESFASHRLRLDIWGKEAPRRFFGEKHWSQPIQWNRRAAEAGVRARVFCASMADLCEDRGELNQWRARLMELVDQTPWLDWLFLTKRPENYLPLFGEQFFRDHSYVWPGTTTENQEQADLRIPELMKVPGSGFKWLSVEPMLGPVSFWHDTEIGPLSYLKRYNLMDDQLTERIEWVIYGGESTQPGFPARLCELRWIRDGLAECRAAGVAAFVKQLGSKPVHPSDPLAWIPKLHPACADPNEWPEDLRVREFPVGYQVAA